MAKAGYDSYLFCRPGQGNCPLPADDFIWVGFDGSRIAAHRADTYGTLMGEAGKQWRNGWIGSAAGRKGSSRQWAVSSGAWETTEAGRPRGSGSAQGAEGKDGGLESGPLHAGGIFCGKE